MVSLSALGRASRKRLCEAGCEDAARDVRELLCRAYGLTQEQLLRDGARTVDPARVEPLLARRAAGEPLAYVLGEWEFYGYTLRVTPDVLIPRDDTAVLVDVAREAISGSGARFLDLCTGSGCVGIALAGVCPQTRGVLLDVSRAALAVAAENIERNGLQERLIAVWGDVLDAPEPSLGGFDAVLANPPYVTEDEWRALDASVRAFEPEGALCGGADGLRFYDAILERWCGVLRPGGLLAFECGWRQADALAARLRGAGFLRVGTRRDLQQIERVVFGYAPDGRGR